VQLGFKSLQDLVQEFQLSEVARYKKIEEKSVEAKISGISHRSRDVGRKTSSQGSRLSVS
jgi:hypothetical protein